ncbi:MAG: glycosyltransferase family 9 protein [Cytophagaceae bacterium]
MVLPNVQKIAILRANALGDFIVTLPAIQALQHTYPQAEIILLGKPWHKTFLEGKYRCPVSRVITIPVTKGIREEKRHYRKSGRNQGVFSENERRKIRPCYSDTW